MQSLLIQGTPFFAVPVVVTSQSPYMVATYNYPSVTLTSLSTVGSTVLWVLVSGGACLTVLGGGSVKDYASL